MMSESDADYLRRLARDIGLHRPRGLVPQGKAMCNIADRFESLLAESKALWEQNRLERRIKNRLAAFLESEGYDVDEIPSFDSTQPQESLEHWKQAAEKALQDE